MTFLRTARTCHLTHCVRPTAVDSQASLMASSQLPGRDSCCPIRGSRQELCAGLAVTLPGLHWGGLHCPVQLALPWCLNQIQQICVLGPSTACIQSKSSTKLGDDKGAGKQLKLVL